MASITTAPSVAAGSVSNRPARKSIVSSTSPALISDATCVRWPAVSATDVFDRLPSLANPPTKPAAAHAAPWAISSWSGSISYRCLRAVERAAASDSE